MLEEFCCWWSVNVERVVLLSVGGCWRNVLLVVDECGEVVLLVVNGCWRNGVVDCHWILEEWCC